MSDEQAKTETQTESSATEQAAPDLTVQDLQSLKAVIDVASQRGAFKPNEMVSVGQVYNKLDLFLNAVQAAQAAQAPNS